MHDFRSALSNKGLMDLGWVNHKFTWSNRHNDNTYTRERLDRVVVYKLWLENFVDNRVEVLTTSTSDHLPILITTRHKGFSSGSRKRPFRYEAKWAFKEDGEEVIRQAWQQHTFGPNCWA